MRMNINPELILSFGVELHRFVAPGTDHHVFK